MKKITLLLFAVFVINSCTTEDNSPQVYYELLPIESCEVPDFFVSGETYQMELFYVIPTTCHFYRGIYFDKQENVRILAVQSGVVSGNTCTNLIPGDTISTTFDFKPTNEHSYIFKFWKGKNELGEDTYYEIEIPVQN